MSNLSKVIKDWMCITVEDVRYFYHRIQIVKFCIEIGLIL